MEGKWIRFEKQPQKDGMKTSVYLIVTTDGNSLGEIKWFASWRKYCFFPNTNTLYETDCLSDIVKFLNKLMLDRKIEKQNLK